jgi:hypothetical protein
MCDHAPDHGAQEAAPAKPCGPGRQQIIAPPGPVLTARSCQVLLSNPHINKEFTINHQYGSLDPPRTLAERLSRLKDDLQSLGERLKTSIASLVGDAVAETVRDSLRKLLGGKEAPSQECFHQRRDHFSRSDYRDERDDPWNQEERRWSEEDDFEPPARRTTATNSVAPKRWRNALTAALQTCLWFLKQQPRQRPVLTTVCVTLAAGVAGFVAGPVLAAGASVFASVAGLLLTTEASQSAAEFASG